MPSRRDDVLSRQAATRVSEGDPLFAFAGLRENWRDKKAGAGAEWIRTCAVITSEPNELVAPIHDRMPVILPREAWATWLGEKQATKEALLALLRPYPAERMRANPISTRGKNDERVLGLLARVHSWRTYALGRS